MFALVLGFVVALALVLGFGFCFALAFGLGARIAARCPPRSGCRIDWLWLGCGHPRGSGVSETGLAQNGRRFTQAFHERGRLKAPRGRGRPIALCSRGQIIARLVVVDTDRLTVTPTCVKLDEAMREKAADTPDKSLALAHDDRVRTQLEPNPLKDLSERPPAIRANVARRIGQVAFRAH